MTNSLAAEVVVVGGGPAGSVTAALLARRGHEVLLLDRSEFPRSKPCGESVNPGAVRELDRLGLLQAVLELPHQIIRRWIIHPHRGAAFEGYFEEGVFGIAIDRTPFDALLLDHAKMVGVEVRTGARVIDVVTHENTVTGVRLSDDSNLSARLVVGADGLRSVVVRRLGLLRRQPKLRKLALTAHVQGAHLPAESGILSVHPWGCIGIVAISETLSNVVQVIEHDFADDLHGDPESTFDRLVASSPYLTSATRCSAVQTTGPFDFPTRAVIANGAMLVGDAAGYFDPFTGQGIYRALRGAHKAAEVASRCLGAGGLRLPALKPYQTWHDHSFGASNLVQRGVELAISHTRILQAAAATFRARPMLADRLIAVTGDAQPVRYLISQRAFPGYGVAKPFVS